MAREQRLKPLARQLPGAVDSNVSLAGPGPATDCHPTDALELGERVDLAVGQRLDLPGLRVDLRPQRIGQRYRPAKKPVQGRDDLPAIAERVRAVGVAEDL